MAVAQQKWSEIVVPAGYNDPRKLQSTLEEIKKEKSMEYQIQADRDRWIIRTSRTLSKGEKDRISKLRDETIKSLKSSQVPRSQSPQIRRQGPGSQSPPLRKRPTWASAVRTVLAKNQKTAFEKLGLVKWGNLRIRGAKVSRAAEDSDNSA